MYKSIGGKLWFKKSQENLNNLRDSPCSWIRRLSIIMLPNLSMLNYRIKKIPNKNFIKLFCGYWQTYSKIYIEMQMIQQC